MNNPKYIDIELNTNCNMHCSFCPYHEEHKNPQFMDIGLYEKLIKQIYWKGSIKLCQRGEPLLSPILIDAIKIANKRKLRTVINTNGLLLDKLSFNLINAGLEALILSDYGLKEQLNNGEYFAQINKWHQFHKQTSVKFIIKTEKPDIWEGIADIVLRPIYYDHSGTIEDDTPLPNWKCEQLFERLVIDPDGKVRCCCGHIHPQKYVGDTTKNTLMEIWKSKKLKHYRKLHEKGESHKLEMCRKCDYRRSVVKKCQK